MVSYTTKIILLRKIFAREIWGEKKIEIERDVAGDLVGFGRGKGKGGERGPKISEGIIR